MNKIKNFDSLNQTELRKQALLIAEAGLEAIDTFKVIENNLNLEGNLIKINNQKLEIDKFKRIFVFTIGKSALIAAKAIENILKEKITDGFAFYIGEENFKLSKIEAFKGTHPHPSDINVLGSKKLIQKLKNLTENDLVIFVISGGGSALLCLPSDDNFLTEVEIFNILTRNGANIIELNTLRKHLSLARGGFLSYYSYPAKVISLIFSDVLGNDLQFISSGPTILDKTTINDAQKILEKYNVYNFINQSQIHLIETPKDEKYFSNVSNILALSNNLALEAMAKKALELGFSPHIKTNELSGEAKEKAIEILNELKKYPSNTALLYGGETTVTISGRGRGGRNLEMVLAAGFYIEDNELFLAFDSDGRDHGEFAGAIADKITKKIILENQEEAKMYLLNNDEYPFFEKFGNYLYTGDTGSNVSDLIIVLKND
jgi:glycerate-2-kinase